MSATVREARLIEQPGARNAPRRTPQLSSPGHAPCPSRQKPRCMRPLPPRQARPRAHRSRHGCGPPPPPLRASVSSVQRTQETRQAAAYTGPCSSAPSDKGPAACARSRRGRRVPAPTARAMGAGLPRPRSAPAFRVSKGHKKRVSPHRPARYPGANRPHQPSEVRRARGPGRSIFAEGAGRAHRSFRSPPSGRFEPSAQVPTGHTLPSGALQAEIRIQRHARWIRQPCASKATLRRPPPGEVGGRRTPPVGKDRRQPSFSDALIAVCRSSPRCPR